MGNYRILDRVFTSCVVAVIALGLEVAKAQANGEYHVGPGDTIQISVWKEPEVSAVVVVRPDGKISVPLVNEITVSGKTPMEIQEMVTQGLSHFIKDPNVTISVRDIQSRKVYILGEVNRPGSYQILQPTTVLQLLTEAGGLRLYAKEKDIYILRMENGKQRKFPFNYKDAVGGKQLEQNILLEPNDTVVVP
jgi:polysaccharide export outer membrane protein